MGGRRGGRDEGLKKGIWSLEGRLGREMEGAGFGEGIVRSESRPERPRCMDNSDDSGMVLY